MVAIGESTGDGPRALCCSLWVRIQVLDVDRMTCCSQTGGVGGGVRKNGYGNEGGGWRRKGVYGNLRGGGRRKGVYGNLRGRGA